MRWNKQYLDLLANKCSFEDEERYMEFLEALHTVANRCLKKEKKKPVYLTQIGRNQIPSIIPLWANVLNSNGM